MRITRRLSFAACTLLMLTSMSGVARAGDQNWNFIHMAYKQLTGVDVAPGKAAALYEEMTLLGWLTKDDIVNLALGDPARRTFVVGQIYQKYLHRPATAYDQYYWGTGQQMWTSEADFRAAVLATDEFFNLPCPNGIGLNQFENFTCNVGTALGVLSIAQFTYQNAPTIQSGAMTRHQLAYLELGRPNGGSADGGVIDCRDRMWNMVVYQGDSDSLFAGCLPFATNRDEEGVTNFSVHSHRYYENAKYYKP